MRVSRMSFLLRNRIVDVDVKLASRDWGTCHRVGYTGPSKDRIWRNVDVKLGWLQMESNNVRLSCIAFCTQQQQQRITTLWVERLRVIFSPDAPRHLDRPLTDVRAVFSVCCRNYPLKIRQFFFHKLTRFVAMLPCVLCSCVRSSSEFSEPRSHSEWVSKP